AAVGRAGLAPVERGRAGSEGEGRHAAAAELFGDHRPIIRTDTKTPMGTANDSQPAQPLAGVKVLDLSRVLAGPWCTQTLADLGAEVIKVERPGSGDDTRGWGPPFLKDRDGADTQDAAYYLSTNRNKRSITVDIACADGQALIREMVAQCDVF